MNAENNAAMEFDFNAYVQKLMAAMGAPDAELEKQLRRQLAFRLTNVLGMNLNDQALLKAAESDPESTDLGAMLSRAIAINPQVIPGLVAELDEFYNETLQAFARFQS